MLGENKALVDNTPGLTRDRKEADFKMFGVKLRIVDTAGVEDFEESKKYEDILNKTIEQTRKALIYSDLAFFLIDARKGVTFTDIKLANWINKIKKMQEDNELNIADEVKDSKEHDEDEKIEDNNSNFQDNDNLDNKDKKRNSRRERFDNKKSEREKFYEKLKEIKETDEIRIPPIKLIANKCENNFVPDDVFCDFINLKLGEPLLISAEHGDNMVRF